MTAPRTGRLAILGTGGTIGNTEGGRIPIRSVVDGLAQELPALDGLESDLVVEEASRVAGSEMSPVHWLGLRAHAMRLLDRQDIDGLVITHGTFTVEETAWYLHLTLNTPKPVVVTCAQRKHGTLGNDGDRNLLDAIAVARSGATAGIGVVVAIGQEIHSAREIVKLSQRPNGFGSRDFGLVGTIDDGEIVTYRRPTRRHTVDSEFARLPGAEPMPRVDVVATYAGADGTAIEALVAAGARGLVLEGFPYSGKPTAGQAASLADADRRGVSIVLANRGGYGRVPSIAAAPWTSADNLTAVKARVLLMLALAAGRADELPRIFAEY
jgi:L-asparaginase